MGHARRGNGALSKVRREIGGIDATFFFPGNWVAWLFLFLSVSWCDLLLHGVAVEHGSGLGAWSFMPQTPSFPTSFIGNPA